ncbi:amidohydrolase family protein [Croceibacterium aestuarii]|uniref:amidohydrolase family protein n=1 Tax=Croceibacterium aestuarii TaxID=3064139 RepID=UPI00272E167F|nr:amidohydrolase family protein [Croceibacterium sp. D39]
MTIDRRKFLAATAAGAAVAGSGSALAQQGPMRRIAVEEAWSFPEIMAMNRDIAVAGGDNLDLVQLRPPPGANPSASNPLVENLFDTDRRLEEMDRLGIDMHVLSLTSPGVQLLGRADAVRMASVANDRLARIVADRPARFGGLASFSPQDPAAAAREMERAIDQLGLHGFIVNSHTDNLYLDDPRFGPILEAAEALDRPIYIHPRCPSDGLAGPFRDNRLRAAIWGYAIETGTHAMRMILSDVFVRYPKLRIVLGHMGENVPYYLSRADHWYEYRPQSYEAKLKPSEVFLRNFAVTTSGFVHAPTLAYAVEVLGAENVLWAIDYPYEEMEPTVRFMDEVQLPGAVKRAIYGGNAAHLFKLPG